jgi:hypothetical protein
MISFNCLGSQCNATFSSFFQICPSNFISNPYTTNQTVNVSFPIQTTDEYLKTLSLPNLQVYKI